MLRQLALATFAAATLLAVQSPANAGPVIVSGPWGCRDCGFSNGTQHSGLTVQGVAAPVRSVILPSGEIVALP